jgi:threonine dehydratase
MPPTPQYSLAAAGREAGAEVWVKHENHTPTGAFKVRGALHLHRLAAAGASGGAGHLHGDAGQSRAGPGAAATAAGLKAKVYVPRGNSVEKNAAMAAFGAELIEFGEDFDTAREEAFRVAEAEGLAVVPPFHPSWCAGWRPMAGSFSPRCPISTRSMCRSAAARASAG